MGTEYRAPDRRLPQARAGGWATHVLAVALIACTILLVLLHAPVVARATAAAASVFVVAWVLAKRSAATGVEKVAMSAGFVLVALVLGGVAMNAVGAPLTPLSWSLGLGLGGVALIGLDLARRPLAPQPAGDSAGRARNVALAGWVAAALALGVVAVGMSVANKPNEQASLAFSLTNPAQARNHDPLIAVTVTTTRAVKDLQIRVENPAGQAVGAAQTFSLNSNTSKNISIAVPATGRYVIVLRNPAQTAPLRTLILDR